MVLVIGRNPYWIAVLFISITTAACTGGCHDGPMYALKRVNPWYTAYEWKADEALATTDAQREAELKALISQIDSMPPAEQQSWVDQLDQLMEHDQSAHMRALAVRAAANSNIASSLGIIERGLDDDDSKVRIVSAQSLAARSEQEATRLIIKTIHSESNKDVRLAAITSLGNHRGDGVTETLRSTLEEPDLAYQYSSIASLRKVTGKDAGQSVDAWIAMLDSPASSETAPSETDGKSWASRLRKVF